MRLGVFGGTFDPPHLGHLVVAQDACTALSLDRILFVLAAEPPHKLGLAHAPAAIRLEMLQVALAGDDRFEASDVELRRSGPSYTVDTLLQLAQEHPAVELVLLVGADQAREFQTWRSPDEIARLATVVALSREGDAAAGLDPRVRPLPVTRLDISATAIRRRAAEGLPIRYLVVPGVEAIIRREGLYRGQNSPAASVPGADRAGTAGV